MVDDFKNIFTKNNNQHIQIIVLAVILFLSKLLISTFYNGIFTNFTIANFINLNPWTTIFFPLGTSSILNLLFTSIMLYWVGLILADFIGGKKMLLAFLWSAYGAFFVFFIVSITKAYFLKELSTISFSNGLEVGVCGVLFSCVTLLPLYELMIFRFAIKLKYLAFIILILNMAGNPKYFFLYLISAIIGYIYIKFIQTDFTKSRKKIVPEVVKKPKASISKSYFPSEEEINHLLDKIGKVGFEGLSKEEQERLNKASEKQD